MPDAWELPQIAFLDPRTLRFRQGEREAPHVTVEGDRSYLEVRVRLAFPFSLTDSYIVVHDARDEMIGMLGSTEGLDADSTAIIDRELDRRYFRPQILEIRSLSEEYGCTFFEVETSRGLTRFTVRNVRENVRENLAGKLRIRDMHGSIFEIPSLKGLDSESRKKLEVII